MTFFSIVLLSPLSWAVIGAPLGNHLWQSTVFAGAVWLLTLLLRKNSAQSRYVLWLVASAKFLFPFSLLIALGSQIPWTKPPATPPSLFVMTQVLSEPFATGNPGPVTHALDTPLAALLRALPTLLFIVWSCGCAAVLFFWWNRRCRLTAAMRGASPVQTGREVEALSRLEQRSGMTRQIELKVSPSALEPGILGIFRPVMLLPQGISDRLTDAQLESIIAHELCHVRRRDNLAAVLHMFVETIFWFHPLVWWMGARLVEERECACDEEVLRQGADPHVYAEGILKVCKFYLESPLFCAAGVTGSNLKKRIEAIMIHRSARKLDLGRKLLLAATSLVVVLGPIGIGFAKPGPRRGQSQPPPAAPPSFQDVSIKPAKSAPTDMHSLFVKKENQMRVLTATNMSVKGLIADAYGLHEFQISGSPDWISVERYDITAKIPVSGQIGPAFKKLITDRFKLALHRETSQVAGHALVIAPGGPKLQQAKPGDTYPDGLKSPEGRPLGAGFILEPQPCQLVGQAVSIAVLAGYLSMRLGSSVVDETGLKGNYDFNVNADCHEASTERGEPLLTLIREQLGLELKAQTVPTEVLVIDHVEKITGDEASSSQSQPQTQNVAESVAASMPAARVYDDVSIYKSSPNSIPTSDFSPDGFTATNVTLQNLIQWAYGVESFQIYGAPNWLDRERYDVKAKLDSSLANDMRNLTKEQLRFKQQPMLLELLADLFRLEVHRDTRELPIYDLVVAGPGSKLQPAPAGELPEMRGHMRFGRVLIAGQSMAIGLAENGRPSLVQMLSQELQRPVLDKTGLKGAYDFSLEWTPDASLDVEHGPSFFAAIQDQLGLTLQASNEQTARVAVLVIDHAEQLTGNEHWAAARLN